METGAKPSQKKSERNTEETLFVISREIEFCSPMFTLTLNPVCNEG